MEGRCARGKDTGNGFCIFKKFKQTTTMEQYRKKPVVIEAMQFTGNNATEVMLFVGQRLESSIPPHQIEFDKELPNNAYHIIIPTLEGKMKASKGDWIIKGVNGEFYPCKNEIFEKTYEPATQPPSAPGVEETKNEIWLNSILNLQGREKEFYDMLRYYLNDEELAQGYCSSFESIAKKYDASTTQGAVWVKVSDKLPEQFNRVLVAYDDSIVLEAFVNFDGKWKFIDKEWNLNSASLITHWMPLPNLPSQSTPSKEDAVEFLEWYMKNRREMLLKAAHVSKEEFKKVKNMTTEQLYGLFKNKNK
jgi:hypothetical protein